MLKKELRCLKCTAWDSESGFRISLGTTVLRVTATCDCAAIACVRDIVPTLPCARIGPPACCVRTIAIHGSIVPVKCASTSRGPTACACVCMLSCVCAHTTCQACVLTLRGPCALVEKRACVACCLVLPC